MSRYRQTDALLRSLEAPLRTVLHPLGFRMEVETNDRRVIECAESSFGVFPPASHTAPPMRMRLVRGPGEGAPPATPGAWPKIAHRSHADIFTVVCNAENFVVADMARSEMFGFLSNAMLDDLRFFRAPFVECPTYTVLVRNYLTPVHASCVVRDGRAICLCGPPAAGKTSLAYWCARAGYQFLSNDAIYIVRGATQLRVRGNPSFLNFRLEARELFPEFARVPESFQANGEPFLPVPAAELRCITEAEVGALVLLNRGAKPALETVAPEEAHRLLMADLVLDDDRTMQEHEAAMWRLVETGAYRLSYTTFEEAQKQLDHLPCLAAHGPNV